MFLKKQCYTLFLCSIYLTDIVLSSCPYISLPHGKIRYLNRGRKVKFSCFKPYTLVGSLKLECKNGKWNGQLPVCALSKHCEPLPKLYHGKITYFNERALARVECDEDFSLRGSSVIYCGIYGWNDTIIPECRANSIHQFGTCNFEYKDEEQCKWISKNGLFNWTIMSSSPQDNIHMPTNSFPIHDHTLESNSTGHFLYLETLFAPTKKWLGMMDTKNAPAKYISPMFPPINEDEPHCLIFYLYANGSHAGIIEVLANEDSIWKSNGSLGTEWNEIKIPLHDRSTEFRLTIEGKGELGQYTSTAIDDLKIAVGEECQETHKIKDEAVTEFRSTDWITSTLVENSHDRVPATIQNNLETERYSEQKNHQLGVTISPHESNDNNPVPIYQPIATSNTPSVVDHSELNMIKNNIIPEESHISLKINDNQSTAGDEITITENDIIFNNSIENKADKNVVEEQEIYMNSTRDHKSDKELQINITTTSLFSNKFFTTETLNKIETSLNNDIDALKYYLLKKKKEETNRSVENSTYFNLVSNNTIVESNDAKYKYNHQEENGRDEINQKVNNRWHSENEGSFLQKSNNQNQNYEIRNHSSLHSSGGRSSSNNLLGGKIFWVTMSVIVGGMLMFIAQIYKRYHIKNRKNNESSIPFIKKDDDNSDLFQRKEDILMLDSIIPQKMT